MFLVVPFRAYDMPPKVADYSSGKHSMLRLSALLLVALLCVWHAPAPDPRVVAAMRAAGVTIATTAAPSVAAAASLPQYPDGAYFCPMDKDVRMNAPGKCPKCGMKLVEGVMDILEYPETISTAPAVPKANEITRLTFNIVDPRTSEPVRNFEVVHEKLFHFFAVSQDMKFFLHTHPERSGDEDFHLDVRFPHPGMYRILSDFYPRGGTPQLLTNTVMVPGSGFHLDPAKLSADFSPQTSINTRAELRILPEHPSAGEKVSMFFRLTPDENMQPYLGAAAHMLVASSDLIDMIHNHPYLATDNGSYRQLQFNMTFPRSGVYRVWIQFQRKDVVNTVAFNVPVDPPK